MPDRIRLRPILLVPTALLLLALILITWLTPVIGQSAEGDTPSPVFTAYQQRLLADREPNHDLQPLAPTPCENGFAGIYPCENVDLLAFMPLSTIGGGSGNDIWGWTDPLTGKEYALMGRSSGTSFVDISDPVNPVYIGNLPTHTSNSSWRDIKVYANYAFVVSEASGHGMQVFDLTRLRSVVSPPVTFTEDAHYSAFSRAHNIVINEDTGFAYAVGSNTCSGGLHMIDISNPLVPDNAGCFSADGYTHDAQCVVYNGPDAAHQGDEICFNANEDTLTIVDVTNKAAPVQLSRTGYGNSAYTHQVWITEDQTYLLLGDELDELNNGFNTRTYIWDIADLDAPSLIGHYNGTTTAIDHNLYIKDDRAYESNYRAGLQILDIADIANANLSQVAFFDVYPSSNSASFNGTWSNYPYFDSGVVIVSGIEQGLFVLQPKFGDFTLTVDDPALSVCSNGGFDSAIVSLDGVDGYSGDVDLSTTGLPFGTVAAFDPETVSVPGDSTLTVSWMGTPQGNYLFSIVGDDGSRNHSVGASLSVLDGNLTGAALVLPVDGATDQPLRPLFEWEPVANADTYEIQVATDAGFGTIVAQASGLSDTTFTPGSDLAEGTEHFWRVRGHNDCGDGAWSSTFAFTTESAGMAGVSINPTASTKSDLPDTIVTHTFVVTNDGTETDNFTLAISGSDWETSAQGTTGDLNSGASVSIDVTVTIPPLTRQEGDPVILDSDIFILTATSMTDSGVSAEATGTTNAISYPGVSLSADTTTQSALTGGTVTYQLTVTNAGDFTDTFAVSIGESDWTTTASTPNVGPLAAGATGTVDIMVTVGAGVSDSVVVTATSSLDMLISDSVVLMTEAILPGVTVTSPQDTQSATSGETLTFTIDIENTGNVTDTFDLAFSGNSWPTSLSDATVGPLTPGESASIEVYVIVGLDVSDSVTVSAESQLSASVSDSVVLYSLSITPGVSLSADATEQAGLAGAVIDYPLTVTNSGDTTDTFALSFDGALWDTVLSADTAGPLDPGQSAVVTATVVVPATGSSDSVTVQATSSYVSTINDSVTLTTTAWRPDVTVTAPVSSQSGVIGGMVTYTVTIENSSNVTDTYALAVSDNVWATALSVSSSGSLAPGESVDVFVTVMIGGGSSDTAVITATSSYDETVQASVSLTTSTHIIVMPFVARP